MITDTIKIADEELEAMLAEAQASNNLEGGQLATQYTQVLAELIKKDPRQYRSYGPYWWPLKSMLISQGEASEVGTKLEAGTLEHYTHQTPDLTVCAAWAYQQTQLDNGRLYTADHQLDLEDGELYEYSLYDKEMEMLISYQALQ
ncbi:TPA: hypothetical protein ACRTTK_003142 [Aeromonas hydrophila]|uniref:hypothetical protein n=1 Tax=Aeromonas hydrophila TaxID=644 RepID=UPI0024430607|nr:hypothetical protein [Aeromonas hydrophila]